MKIEVFTCNPIQENTYIVYDETKECIIIDCGCLFDVEKEKLKDFIDENKLILKRVINTHLHLDHSFGNRFLFNEYGIKPEAHQADEFLIPQMAMQADVFGIPMNDEAMPLGGYLNEGDTIKVGHLTFEILHVPGHSPGSLVFYEKNEHVLFVGDVLFKGSIGRTDLPKGSYSSLIENIQSKIMVLPPQTVVFSGHGPTTTIAYEMENNPFLR